MIFADKGETIYTTETVYSDETGLPVRQLTWLGSVLQSPPDDTPAQVLFDDFGRVHEMVWWHKGEEHRDPKKGPAVIKLNPDNGIHILERYELAGKISRSSTEPALICRDRTTGKVTLVEYYLDGVRLSQSPSGVDPDP